MSGRLERCLIGQGERVVRVRAEADGQSRARRARAAASQTTSTRSRSRGRRCAKASTRLPAAFLDERRDRDPAVGRPSRRSGRRAHAHAEPAALASGRARSASWRHRRAPRALDRACLAGPDRPAPGRDAADRAGPGRARADRARSASSTAPIRALERELETLVASAARRELLDEVGCGPLTAAKLIGASPAPSASHRCATSPARPAPRRSRPPPAAATALRLDRGGDRQLNCALHRIAVTRARADPETAAYLDRKLAEGKTRTEACAASNATSPAASGSCCDATPTPSPLPHAPRPPRCRAS